VTLTDSGPANIFVNRSCREICLAFFSPSLQRGSGGTPDEFFFSILDGSLNPFSPLRRFPESVLMIALIGSAGGATFSADVCSGAAYRDPAAAVRASTSALLFIRWLGCPCLVAQSPSVRILEGRYDDGIRAVTASTVCRSSLDTSSARHYPAGSSWPPQFQAGFESNARNGCTGRADEHQAAQSPWVGATDPPTFVASKRFD